MSILGRLGAGSALWGPPGNLSPRCMPKSNSQYVGLQRRKPSHECVFTVTESSMGKHAAAPSTCPERVCRMSLMCPDVRANEILSG